MHHKLRKRPKPVTKSPQESADYLGVGLVRVYSFIKDGDLLA